MTAVEWLVEQLIPKAFVTYDSTTYNAIQQAKQMEKEQMINAQSYAVSHADMTNNKGYFDCEQYYKEQYGCQGSPDTSPNTQNK